MKYIKYKLSFSYLQSIEVRVQTPEVVFYLFGQSPVAVSGLQPNTIYQISARPYSTFNYTVIEHAEFGKVLTVRTGKV